MFRRLLEKMAAKSCLFNIKCDINELRSLFPSSGKASAKKLLILMENIMYARDDAVPDEHILSTLVDNVGDKGSNLETLVITAYKVIVAAMEEDPNVIAAEQELTQFFLETTGETLDWNKLSLTTKMVNLMLSLRGKRTSP